MATMFFMHEARLRGILAQKEKQEVEEVHEGREGVREADPSSRTPRDDTRGEMRLDSAGQS